MKTRRSAAAFFAAICFILYVGTGCRTSNRVDFTDPVLNQRRVLLVGPIDQQKAEFTINRLLYLDGKTNAPIDFFIQTPGGEMKSTCAIEQVMRLMRSPVNTYALAECNSGGAMLLAAGTGKRRAFEGSVLVIHGITMRGTPPQGFVEKLEVELNAFWRTHARLPETWFPLTGATNHVLTAAEALSYGLVDEVVKR
jgi:ATP-dependent Clp protease, protease subunit